MSKIRWHCLARYPAYRESLAAHHAEGSISLTFPSPYRLHAPTELAVTDSSVTVGAEAGPA